jgi:hypothetical protein
MTVPTLVLKPEHQGRQRAAEPLIQPGWLVGYFDEQVLRWLTTGDR